MSIEYNNTLLKNLNKVNMDICDVGYAKLDSSWRAENVCSTIFRVYIPIKGEGIIESASEYITMLPNNIYIIPSFMTFSYRCEDYFEKLYYHVNVTRPNNYDIFKGVNRFITLENRSEEVKRLITAFENGSLDDLVETKKILYVIVWEALKACTKNENIEFSAITERAIDYIGRSLSAALSVKEVASFLFISQSKLQKNFKKETGVSVGRYIDDRIMFVAEREIKRGLLSLKEISEKLGFCDQFYFSRKFSEYYGCSPTNYKKYMQ